MMNDGLDWQVQRSADGPVLKLDGSQATNIGDKMLSQVQITFLVNDAHGSRVGTIQERIAYLAPGQAWDSKVEVDVPGPNKREFFSFHYVISRCEELPAERG